MNPTPPTAGYQDGSVGKVAASVRPRLPRRVAAFIGLHPRQRRGIQAIPNKYRRFLIIKQPQKIFQQNLRSENLFQKQF